MDRLTVVLTTAVVACVLCLASVAAQENADRVMLRYTWTGGEEMTWHVTTETAWTTIMRDHTQDPVAETETDMWTSSSMPMWFVVEDVDDDGNVTVSYGFGTIQMDVLVGGQQQYICIDPETKTMTVDGEEQPLPEGMMPGLLDPIKLVMSPLGEVLEITLSEGTEMPFGAGGMDMTQWLRMSQQWQMVFPEQPVGEGYSWGASMVMPSEDDADESADATMVFTMAGTETVDGVECVRIEMVGAMDIAELPAALASGGMGAAMPEGLESTIGPMHMSVRGGFYFDPVAGQLVSSDMSVLMDVDQRMTGTVETPEGAQEIDMTILVRDMLVESKVVPLED